MLDNNAGIGRGFDFLRVFLALSVLFTHSVLIAEGERAQFGIAPLRLLHNSIVPMFFALSGFLITASALRLRLRDFLLNRGMRIVPALAVDIVVSALLIGPIFTTVPLRKYFSSYEFLSYFANIVGLIHFSLPGVFIDNPFPRAVNGSLWTVPFEIGCYTIISTFIVTGALRKRWLCVAVGVLIGACITIANWTHFDPLAVAPLEVLRGEQAHNALHHFFSNEGNHLYLYFLGGCLIYLFRYQIVFSRVVLAASAAVFALGAFDGMKIPPAFQQLIYCPALVYITVFVGLTRLPRIPIYSNGDYSYGIYLYGYPLQQALVASFPTVTSPWLHFAISVPATSLVAMLSWHCVEKPILAQRRKFSFTARKGDPTLTLPQTSVEQSRSSSEPLSLQEESRESALSPTSAR
jgi:peptidoglycan/LPS O-acetylase OafA/YrhL